MNYLGPEVPGLAMLLVVSMTPSGLGQVRLADPHGDAVGAAGGAGAQQVPSPQVTICGLLSRRMTGSR